MKNEIKVTVLHCGDVELDSSPIYREENVKYPECMFFNSRSKEHHLNLPVYCFLIEHPKGKIVFDTGWPKEVRNDPEKAIGDVYLLDRPSLFPGIAIDEQLVKYQIETKDIDYVVLGHLYPDHAGGLQDLKRAKNFLVTQEEFDAVLKNVGYCPSMWQGIHLQTIDFKADKDTPWNKSYDLFNDGSVKIVFLPGHTEGMLGILIQNNEKTLFLNGDCGYSRKSWQKSILPGLVKDEEVMLKSYQWINELYQKEDCIDCISCHETELEKMEYVL